MLATSKDGKAHLDAYLDDHAYLLAALLEMLQADFRIQDLQWARELGDVLMARFHDDAGGGFFFTSHDHEALPHRGKPMSDESLPSGNAVAALALGRLGHLLGEPRYLDATAGTLRAGWQTLGEYPHACATLLMALEEHLEPPELVIVRAPEPELDEWLGVARQVYAPHRLVFGIPDSADGLPAVLAARRAEGRPVAWLCRGTSCGPPLRTLADLGAALARV
jgi:uncharacterized protein YyaL (SSP411 family)